MNALKILDDANELPEFPPIPPRSRLYSLEPVGVGTGMVESLTSYIARLAIAHNLALSSFVSRILSPLSKLAAVAGIGGHYDVLRHRGASLNGAGSTSVECVKILEALTLRKSLRELTLHFTTGWLSDRALLSVNQKWCPRCLGEWKHRGDSVYYPLLWQLAVVRTCPVHDALLRSNCPQCGATHRPLGRHLIPGHCPVCAAWLGSKSGAECRSESQSVRQTCLFVADQARDLITAATTLENRAQTAWSKNIKFLTQQHSCGVAHRLSQDLGINHDTVRCWITAEHAPTLPSALMVSCAFDLNLVDLLSVHMKGEVHFVRSLKVPELSSLFRRELNRHDAKLIEEVLIKAVARPSDPPLSLMAICKKAGCDQSYVSKKFPELARKIIAHRRTYVAIHKQQRLFFTGLITRSFASQLAASGEYPSHRKMSGVLPSWISLRETTAKKAWLGLLEEWGWKRGSNESGK